MTLEIEYIENLLVYPPIIRDIIEEICINGKKFGEMRVWYGDSFDLSIFNDTSSKLCFNETYLLEKTEHNKSIYVPYDKIFEIIIDYEE